MAAAPSKGVRVAAGIVCAVFAVFVAFHLLWAVGVTWGLDELFPGNRNDASIELTIASLAGAAAGGEVIFVTISRVGWHQTRLPDRLIQLGAWVVFAWPAIGTLNPDTSWGQRAVTLPLAIAAFMVARAHPAPPRAAPPSRRRALLKRGRRAVGDALRPGHRVPRWPPPSRVPPTGR